MPLDRIGSDSRYGLDVKAVQAARALYGGMFLDSEYVFLRRCFSWDGNLFCWSGMTPRYRMSAG